MARLFSRSVEPTGLTPDSCTTSRPPCSISLLIQMSTDHFNLHLLDYRWSENVFRCLFAILDFLLCQQSTFYWTLFKNWGVYLIDDATPFISKGFQFGLSYRGQELFIDVCPYILLYVFWHMEFVYFHFLKRSY